MTQFKIYSSSAGSGKTYTLTKEYLKLALQNDNPHYFKNILAITFTNDAANEMKERIVESLRGFAMPEQLSEKARKKSAVFLDEIAQELQESREKIAQRAKQVFTKILYNYTDFAVSTIDKFVNKVIGSFTKELEIPYNYEVDLDTDTLLQNAIDRVIEKVGREQKENLSNFLIDWVTQKAEEGKNWSRVADELVRFAKELMNENAYPYLDRLKKLEMEDFRIIYHQFQKHQEKIETHILLLGQRGFDLIEKRGLEASFSGGVKASVASYFHKHSEEVDFEYVASRKAYMVKALEQDKWYKEKVNAAIDEIKEELRALILEIESFKDTNRSNYLIIQNASAHIYKLALVHEIEQELAEVKRENNTIHISDTNKKIAEIIAKEPVPYIYERVGEKYHHILIDEFQDTSLLQWQNLLPLIENNISEGYFNLIVGDAKQAIYRWRGGEMEQLVYLYQNDTSALIQMNETESDFLFERYETLGRYHTPAQLNYNFRSTKEVIEFNNHFFSVLQKSDFGVDYPLFAKIYEEGFIQKIPEQNLKTGGHIEIRFLEKSDSYAQEMQQQILLIIEQALQEGYQWSDIAILSRNNTNGSEIANFLKDQKIEVISQDSLLLLSDEKIRFLIAMLKVIHKPEDKLAKSEALYLFYRVIKGINPSADQNQQIKELLNKSIVFFYEKMSQEGFPIHYPKLQALNLYELVEKLISIFRLLDNQPKLEYLFRFMDVILHFNQQKNTTLADFLEYWEEKKHALSINTDKKANAITVTSIHKSKGLEYPVVIAPFADWSFHPRNGTTIWVNLEDDVFEFVNEDGELKKLDVALVMLNQKLLDTVLAKDYKTELEKNFIENVNLLYVAFTRAVDRLYVLTKNDSFNDKGQKKYINYLIYLYLQLTEKWQDGQTEYILAQGNPKNEQKVEETSEENIFWIEEFITTDVHKKLKSKGKKKEKAAKKNEN